VRYHDAVRWLIDGYNVIRASPELLARERESLQAGRDALCRVLARAADARGDRFMVVFDGSGSGGAGRVDGVRILFSSARETADHVIARLASQAGAVVSNDREVRRAAARGGAITVMADEFLARLEGRSRPRSDRDDDESDRSSGPKKGNPRRLGKKARAAARVLGRLGGAPPPGGR
jgi:predicted RNA-binding protein with PIN domain